MLAVALAVVAVSGGATPLGAAGPADEPAAVERLGEGPAHVDVRVAAPVALVVSAGAAEDGAGAGPAVDAVTGGLAAPVQAGEGLDPGAAAEDGGAGEGGGRTGPEPTGQPLPDRSQRILDSAIWLGLLVALAVAFVWVARLWWTSPSVRPVLGGGDDRTDDERAADGDTDADRVDGDRRGDPPADAEDGSARRADRPAEGVEGQG